MSSTTPTGSWRTKRVKPGTGGRGSSRSASAAMDIMARARCSVVFTSPRACESGLPICCVTSRAMRSPSFSNCWQNRSQSATRSGIEVRAQALCARNERVTSPSIWEACRRRRSATVSPE